MSATRTTHPKSPWKSARLGQVCEVIGGSTPASGHSSYWGGDIVWVTPSDLGRLTGRAISESARRITESGYESCGTRLVPTGTVVLSSRAPIGHLAIAGTALCTNQGCKSFIPSSDVDSEYLYYALKKAVPDLQALGSGATFAEVSKSTLESFTIPLPPLSEQRRIAAILNEQMGVTQTALKAAEERLWAAQRLAAAFLMLIFKAPQANRWQRKRLEDVAHLLPSKSIVTGGDKEVRAITTACLTECGFAASGIKTARMNAIDINASLVAPGEVLIARSNTPDLVGRAGVYLGSPSAVVATDLTIRIRPHEGLSSQFLGAYLSFLYLTGYWKERAGGASGSMKKITRTQIMNENVPIPTQEEQGPLVDALNGFMNRVIDVRKNCEEECHLIDSIPAAALRRAFSGDL